MNEVEVENEIIRKNLNAERITPQMVDDEIKSEMYYVFPNTTVTICLLTLQNGYTCTGESACVSAENFDEELGEKIARENARDKIWSLKGFQLKDRQHKSNLLAKGEI